MITRVGFGGSSAAYLPFEPKSQMVSMLNVDHTSITVPTTSNTVTAGGPVYKVTVS